MTYAQAAVLMPRYLDAVTGLATAAEPSIARRLAWVVDQVHVFPPGDYPPDLRPKVLELLRLLGEGKVPPGAEYHPDPVKRLPVAYLHHAKARRAANLITEIFRKIVWTLKHEGTAPDES